MRSDSECCTTNSMVKSSFTFENSISSTRISKRVSIFQASIYIRNCKIYSLLTSSSFFCLRSCTPSSSRCLLISRASSPLYLYDFNRLPLPAFPGLSSCSIVPLLMTARLQYVRQNVFDSIWNMTKSVCSLIPISIVTNFKSTSTMKKALSEMHTLRTGYSKAEPKIFAPPARRRPPSHSQGCRMAKI